MDSHRTSDETATPTTMTAHRPLDTVLGPMRSMAASAWRCTYGAGAAIHIAATSNPNAAPTATCGHVCSRTTTRAVAMEAATAAITTPAAAVTALLQPRCITP